MQSTGASRDFQHPGTSINSIINAIPGHFEAWKRIHEKKDHPLFLVVSGAGTGKSRLLQEFPKILRSFSLFSSELSTKLNESYVFHVTSENAGVRAVRPQRCRS